MTTKGKDGVCRITDLVQQTPGALTEPHRRPLSRSHLFVNLTMGPILDPGSPLSLPILPSVPMGLFEVRSMGTMLPLAFLPSTGGCVVERSCLACHK
jgi:hypothetical protein